jgi:phosphoribosylglycinamide formyltransferase-1
MKNIVILISGGGSNMAAIAKAAQRDGWRKAFDAQIAAVISNRPDAKGLALARELAITTEVVDHTRFDSRQAFDTELARAIDRRQPALVVLAGFMRVLTPEFVERYRGRLLNIHPSLLPAFPGLDTHQRALDAGCKVAGATVHQVTGELDLGPILEQAVVPVLPGDTAQSLAARVLTQEHLIYPRAIAALLPTLANRP